MAVAGAACVRARRAILDRPTLAVGLVTRAVLTWARKVPRPLIVVAALLGTARGGPAAAAPAKPFPLVPAGNAPDGVGWDPVHRVVGVSDQRDGAVSLIAGAGSGRRRQVPLGVVTGNVVHDAGRGRFRVTVVNATPPDQLVSVDPVAARVVTRIDLPGCRGAHGLRLHPDGRSALVACEGNAARARVGLATPGIATVRVGRGRPGRRRRPFGRGGPLDPPGLLPAGERIPRTARPADHAAGRPLSGPGRREGLEASRPGTILREGGLGRRGTGRASRRPTCRDR